MLCQFATITSDEFIWEALKGLPGVVSAYSVEVEDKDAYAGKFYLIGATGQASSPYEFESMCRRHLIYEQEFRDQLLWMVEDLNLEGV